MRSTRLTCALALAAVMTCAAQEPDRAPGPTADPATVLASSEIGYSESGGIAGRHAEARLMAAEGRVTAEYRPAASGPAATGMIGTVDVERYLELWREAERAGMWTITSPPKTRGADMVQHELSIRLGAKTHLVRWDDGAAMSEGMRRAAEFGQRVLATAREVTTER